MQENLKNENLLFKKTSGEKAMVRIISEVPLVKGKGTFGEIFDTIVEIGGHQKRFIIKKYTEKVGVKNPQVLIKEDTKRAFSNYSRAKEAGLKVFPTFRISNDETSILMTSGFQDNQICLGSNNLLKITDFKESLITEIQNIDSFLSEYFTEGLVAAQKNLELFTDLYFFIVTKTKPVKIDFVLGDLDNLSEAESTKEIGLYNMEHLRDSLLEFSGKNLNPDFENIFLEKVNYYYQQAVNSIKNSNLK